MDIALMRVHPNPYCAELDHDGRCHSHIQYEPNPEGDASLRWVGCRLVAKVLRAAQPHRQIVDAHDHVWIYDLEPVVVPVTAYYLRALRHHELLAADQETHAIAFGGPGGFIEPMLRLAQYAKERGAVPFDGLDDRGCPVSDAWMKALSAAVPEDQPTRPSTPVAKVRLSVDMKPEGA